MRDYEKNDFMIYWYHVTFKFESLLLIITKYPKVPFHSS